MGKGVLFPGPFSISPLVICSAVVRCMIIMYQAQALLETEKDMVLALDGLVL